MQIKKRTIVAFILTILFLILTKNIWLINKPVEVDVDVYSGSNVSIITQLNRKNNNEFIKVRTDKITVSKDRNSICKFKIKTTKTSKRIQFLILLEGKKKPIILKNIKINNGKQILENKNFVVIGATSVLKNEELILYPQSDIIKLQYMNSISIPPNFSFNTEIFISLLILSFLLTYKLTDYIANFETIKNNPRYEVIFLSIFFILLILPISSINQDEISIQENRTLERWRPILSDTGEINYNFGKDFDNWFNDRFFLRENIIKLNQKIKKMFSQNIYCENTRCYSKKTHWAFNTSWRSDTNLEKEFKTYKKNILKLNSFCEKNNIKLYVLIIPDKADIYQKEFKETTNSNLIVTNGYNFAKFMNSEGFDFVISPFEELERQKYLYPYTKGDVHWNELGGYIAYKKLIEQIKKDFPRVKVLKEKDFIITESKYSKTDFNNYPTSGNLYKELNIAESNLDVKYKHFEYKYPTKIKRIVTNEPEEISYSQNGYPKTVYFIGNSFEECLIDFLIPTFKKVVKRRYNTIPPGKLYLSRYQKDILDKNTDILIIQTLSHVITDFNDLFMEE